MLPFRGKALIRPADEADSRQRGEEDCRENAGTGLANRACNNDHRARHVPVSHARPKKIVRGTNTSRPPGPILQQNTRTIRRRRSGEADCPSTSGASREESLHLENYQGDRPSAADGLILNPFASSICRQFSLLSITQSPRRPSDPRASREGLGLTEQSKPKWAGLKGLAKRVPRGLRRWSTSTLCAPRQIPGIVARSVR